MLLKLLFVSMVKHILLVQNLLKGDHELKIYKPKLYLNPSDNTISKRLVSIYNGNITLAENQYTTCSINEYHQKVISIR
jgi:hypothetical protein